MTYHEPKMTMGQEGPEDFPITVAALVQMISCVHWSLECILHTLLSEVVHNVVKCEQTPKNKVTHGVKTKLGFIYIDNPHDELSSHPPSLVFIVYITNNVSHTQPDL